MKNPEKISFGIHTRQLLVARESASAEFSVLTGRSPGLRIITCIRLPNYSVASGTDHPITVTSSHRVFTCFPIIRALRHLSVDVFSFYAYGAIPASIAIISRWISLFNHLEPIHQKGINKKHFCINVSYFAVSCQTRSSFPSDSANFTTSCTRSFTDPIGKSVTRTLLQR